MILIFVYYHIEAKILVWNFSLSFSYVWKFSSTWLVPNDRKMRCMHYSFIAFTFSWRCGQQYVDQVASPFATCTLLLCVATELILYPGV